MKKNIINFNNYSKLKISKTTTDEEDEIDNNNIHDNN